ncbi:thioredoxin domain-containing protein [Nannocystis sp.]|uniref:DsbA family protein n=1 Tax=Nannocystis sp. TaxID=1962667 RepID=UPI0025DDF2ED|nr:thioredoxin domain-containing protein [Nannocystis sp.]MBK7829814.1 thioredoxin domain-containing protein [Nannocystis sp.]
MSDAKPETSNSRRSAASIAIAVLGFAATLGVGFYAGQWIKETWFVPAADLEEGVRFRADLRGDEPQIGPNDALVTIVEWSDFQCPYCARVSAPLKEAIADYPGDVRVIFKHFPLAGHAQASPAARAGWAAHQQGKFWEMHDLMFANQRALLDADFSKYAEQLGLDVARFDKDRASSEANTAVDSDHKSGSKAGLSGTPYFLVNGHNYNGALPAKQWRQIIDYELKAVKALQDKGIARDQIYAELMKDAKATRGGGGGAQGPAKRRPGEPDPAKTYKVPLDARPQHGPDDALVTIVEFSDFQCPFCSKVNPALEQVKKTYAGDLRLVFRQRPLPMHPAARDGAMAALAAHRQGKFFEFHDKLFANPSDMTRPTFVAYATELGLDTAMFELDLESAEHAQMIKDDEAVANKLGARGTPAFFVNGRFLSGAQPFESFAALIDEEKAKAQKLVDAGTPRGQVYDKIMADAEEKPGA